MKDNYNEVPIKDDYIPKHATNYISKQNNQPNDTDNINKNGKKIIQIKKEKEKT